MPTKLKRVIGSVDEVEETFRPFYAEREGKWHLDIEVDGTVPKKSLDDMRQTNIDERQRFEKELEKFKDVNVDEYSELKGRAKDLDEGKLFDKKKIDDIVAPRVQEATKPLIARAEKAEQTAGEYRNQLETALIESGVVQAAIPLGLKKDAGPDLIARARRVFKLNEHGEITAYEGDGKTIRYHNGTEPYTLEVFAIEEQKGGGKHLFEPNEGGGGEVRRGAGAGGDSLSDFGGVNPFLKDSENLYWQGIMMQKNFPLAQRCAAKAGIRDLQKPAGMG